MWCTPRDTEAAAPEALNPRMPIAATTQPLVVNLLAGEICGVAFSLCVAKAPSANGKDANGSAGSEFGTQTVILQWLKVRRQLWSNSG